MLVVLAGKLASGKTTTRDILVEKLNFNPILTYTTRPKRKNERDGIDYYFISEPYFTELQQSGKFIETSSYTQDDVIYRYGSSLDKYDWQDVYNIIILNPDGIYAIADYAKQVGISTHIVILDVEYCELIRRAMNRGDNLDNIHSRICRDDEDFQSLTNFLGTLSDCLISYSIVSIDNDKSPEDVALAIWDTIQSVESDRK